MHKKIDDNWDQGDPYEYFMGRWSTLMAAVFIRWLEAPPGMTWLDIGCGTGALSRAIEQHCTPGYLAGIDPSPNFLESVVKKISTNGEYKVGTAENIPFENHFFDLIVSGLALNFFSDLEKSIMDMRRVAKKSGVIAAYVWDYAGRMEFLRYFWDAACDLDPQAGPLDEAARFPICNSERLVMAFDRAGLKKIEFSLLDIPTVFKNFDDYWNPFLGGQGPAPSYLASLDKEMQAQLKNTIQKNLPIQPDGSINLLGRAIAIRGAC